MHNLCGADLRGADHDVHGAVHHLQELCIVVEDLLKLCALLEMLSILS